MDAYAKKSIATIPEKQRVLITAHDAFGYFSRAYDIKVMAAQGVTTMSEAAISDINKLVNYIAENDVSAIFVENIVSDRNLKAVIEGVKAKGKDVEIGGTLYSDAMGKPGTYEGSYRHGRPQRHPHHPQARRPSPGERAQRPTFHRRLSADERQP